MSENMNNQPEKEITLIDLFRLFVSKWKILVIVALLAAIVGGAIGGLLSRGNAVYKSTISFNLSPSDSTDSLLYNLQSESFAEKLLLEENGLPPKETCNAEDYAAAVEALAAFDAVRKEKAELRLALDCIQMSAIQNEYDKLESAYVAAYDIWSTYMSVQDADLKDDDKIALYYTQMKEAETAWNQYKTETYYPATEEKIDLQQKYNLANIGVRELRIEAEKAVEKVVAPWRENKEVKNQIASIMNSATYQYESLNIPVETGKNAENTKNKGYVKISIAVENDAEFAKLLLERFKERTPDFIEQHIEEISGSTHVECKLISPFASVQKVDEGFVRPAIKTGLIAAVIALVLVYAVLLVRMIVRTNANNKKTVDDCPEVAQLNDEKTIEQ